MCRVISEAILREGRGRGGLSQKRSEKTTLKGGTNKEEVFITAAA